jgi:hypothetical protein
VDDMCYDRRRAEACVDESARHALANAGGREIVGKKEGEQKGSARGSVHWGCYYATAVDIEVDPQCCGLGSCQSDSYKLFINLTLLGHVTENFNLRRSLYLKNASFRQRATLFTILLITHLFHGRAPYYASLDASQMLTISCLISKTLRPI